MNKQTAKVIAEAQGVSVVEVWELHRQELQARLDEAREQGLNVEARQLQSLLDMSTPGYREALAASVR